MSITLTKDLAAVEDIYFGFGIATQVRGAVTQFNASHLPYSSTESVSAALDARLTKVDSDIMYAFKAGSSLQVFNIANGIAPSNAVNKGQLDLKADITEVDLKACKSNVLEKNNSASYQPVSDYNPSTKRYVDESIFNKFINGATGSFTTVDGKTVTVTGGLITQIV